ncbi:type IV toxin-antitoxin system AbiEi family antitoxin [Microbacterium sp. LWS13-1.2]|uniref:Uncharacterized protein n=1 Tax=Microbacterium sp. LWS13-1.2 TaxID=3135264 RepID=A0AAU6SAQ4_9MICO
MDIRENSPSVSALRRAVPPELQPEWDGEVLRISDGWDSWALRPVWVGEGLPADAKRARSEIEHDLEGLATVTPVVTARRISPGAREVLEEQQLSWADASGRAQIVIPRRLYITRLEPIRADAGRAFKWSAAADAVAETLLAWRAREGAGGGGEIEQVAVVAETAGVSVAHTARVLRHFDEQRYTAKTGAERGRSATRQFRDPGRMLSDWAGHYMAGPGQGAIVGFHVPWRDSEQSLSVLAEALADHDWALTAEAAADHIAPYLTSVPAVDLYVPEHQIFSAGSALSQHPEVTGVESGGRIRMHAADAHVFRLTENVKGFRTASRVRVYADLLRQRGRAAEAAEHLRQATIGF